MIIPPVRHTLSDDHRTFDPDEYEPEGDPLADRGLGLAGGP